MLTDHELLQMWLDGKSEATKVAYRRVIGELSKFVEKPLSEINSNDLFRFKWSLAKLSENSVRLYMNVIRSLFKFGSDEGYFATDHARRIKPPKAPSRLAERMLTEQEVAQIIASTRRVRDALFIRFLYATGMRVAEICSLKWRQFRCSTEGCSVCFVGKGSKERTVYFSLALWEELQAIDEERAPEDPIFRSQKGGHIDPSQAWRIVRDSAQRAGVKGNVSPHWFRHSHASHALQRGASLVEVRDTLGHSHIGTTDRYLHSRPGKSSSLYFE